MRKTNLLTAMMAATVIVGTVAGAALAYAPFSLDDTKDTSMTSSYVAGRDLDVSAPGQGTLDLSRLRVVGPPMKLELTLNNTSAHPVNVSFQGLSRNYLVPANSHRAVDLSTLNVGQHTDVSYNVEQILEPVNQEISTASIQYILDSSYVKPWQDDSAVSTTTTERQSASREMTHPSNAVRGYW